MYELYLYAGVLMVWLSGIVRRIGVGVDDSNTIDDVGMCKEGD